MKNYISKCFILIFLLVLPMLSNAQTGCFIHVDFHGHAYNKTPVEIYVHNTKILISNFNHSTITAQAGLSLFFIPESDSCYYVTTTSRSGEHDFRPFFCLEKNVKINFSIFPLKVVVDGNIHEQNIDIKLGRFIRVSYERGRDNKNILHFVQSHETFRDD